MDGARQSPEAVLSLSGDGHINGAAAKLCMAVGCDAMLSELPKYCQQRRLCPVHLKAPALKRKQYEDESLWRFCQQCGKLEPLNAFDGSKRSCRVQLAKRRASSFNKGSASSSSTAGTSSLSKTVSGGIRKTASFNSGNMDRGGLLNGQFSDPQLMLTRPLQQQQQQQQQQLLQQQQSYAEYSESAEYQETDLSGKLLQLKQQVAVMEQQLALLQEQQQMEAELIALQQQYQRTLQNANMQSGTMPEPISAPLSSVGFGSHHADCTFSAPVPCLSAPGCAMPHAPVARRPSLGASAQAWSAAAAAAPGMLGGMQPMPGLPMQSCSTPLQLPTSTGAAAAAGFGTMGHASGPGWLPYDSCVSNCTVLSSNSLNLQPLQHGMLPAGAAAAAAQAQLSRQAPLHTDVWSVAHSMQMSNIPMGTDLPDLQSFIAAGGRLQADCHSASQNGFQNDSSPSNSRPLCSAGGCYSPERAPAGPAVHDTSQGTAARLPSGSTSLQRAHEHAEMLPAPMQAAVPMPTAMANSFGGAHWPLSAGQDHDMPFGCRSLETFAGLLEEVLQEIHAEEGSDMMLSA